MVKYIPKFTILIIFKPAVQLCNRSPDLFQFAKLKALNIFYWVSLYIDLVKKLKFLA